MNNEQVLQLITAEFEAKTLGTTEQYLEIHGPVYENGQIKIERIDRESPEGLIIAYLPVKDEYFSFAVYIDPVTIEIFNIGTESRNTVSLLVSSEKLTAEELRSFTALTPDRIADKGGLTPNKKSVHKRSFIEFTPNPEPDTFEDKLAKLINFLLTDNEGIRALSVMADASIEVMMDFHYGNQLIGAAALNLESIKKLSDLHLPINLHFTAWGKPFND